MKSFVTLVALASSLVVGAFAPVAVLAASPPAASAPPLTTQLTDLTGVLASNTDTITSALARLYDKTGVRLYVLFVNTTGGTNIADYALQAGESSNLGSRDAVLVVSLSDHTDNISLRPDLIDAVSQAGLDDVRTKTLEPGLVSGDYGGAVVRTADALGNVFPPPPTAGPATVPAPSLDTSSAAPAPPPGGGGASLGLVLVLIVIGVGVLALAGRAARRRARPT